jgi:hypothetical protein
VKELVQFLLDVIFVYQLQLDPDLLVWSFKKFVTLPPSKQLCMIHSLKLFHIVHYVMCYRNIFLIFFVSKGGRNFQLSLLPVKSKLQPRWNVLNLIHKYECTRTKYVIICKISASIFMNYFS